MQSLGRRLFLLSCGALAALLATPAHAGLGALFQPKPTNAQVRAGARALRAKQPQLGKVLRAQVADSHVSTVLGHSQKNGNYYIVSDLHMGIGKAAQGGAFDRQEDFTRPEVFVKTLDYLTHQPGNNTLVVGGDFLDLLEHIDSSDSNEVLKKTITQMVKGHEVEFKALAKAVVKDELRIVYLRGNHDIRLADAADLAQSKASVRQHFLGEIARIAGLSESEIQTFNQRVAFAGHMAPLGKFGEMLVFHGEQSDPTNTWRSPVNPYSYTAAGERVIPDPLGNRVVRDMWIQVEKDNPNADNTTESSAKSLAHDLLRNPKSRLGAAKFLWDVSHRRVETSPSQQLAERLDDRRALRAWAEQTGFADMMNAPLSDGAAPRKRSAAEYARTLESIYRQMPTPIHEQMTSPLHTLNAARMVLGGGEKALDAAHSAEPKFLELLTSKLPNVRYVVSGHDHKERLRVGNVPGKGKVGFLDSGTWTRAGGEDRLNVVVAHTDAGGRIKDDADLFRVNQATGAPEFSHRGFEEKDNVVEGWENPRQ
jgi:UDP-2,3-diacylglucosamine pyrophosphatase LpxH